MSRISYSEDEDYPGQFSLWRANLARSLRGKRGKEALRDLRDAMLAMPEKRLIAYRVASQGDVCANGALIAHRRKLRDDATWEEIVARMQEEYAPACDVCWHDKAQHGPLTCTRCDKRHAEWEEREAAAMAAGEPLRPLTEPKPCSGYVPIAAYDEDDEGVTEDAAMKEGVPKLVAWAIVEQNDDLGDWHRDETPEQRYERVLRWVERAIKDPVGAADA